MDLPMTAPDPSSPLLQTFEHQDEIFAPAFSILQQAIIDQAFPAASAAVTHRGKLIALKAIGHFTYEAPSPQRNEGAELKAGAPFLASFARSGAFHFDVTPTTLF